MNCKPGDLAVIVECDPGQEHTLGAYVEVLSANGVHRLSRGLCFCWNVRPNGALRDVWGNLTRDGIAADRILRPIRDNDGQDESLTWAGKPQQINSPELVK